MGGSVVANRWVRVALRGKETDGAFSIRLYIDGEEVAVNQRPSAYSKVNGSFLLPVVGRTASSQKHFFEGLLYSVSLRNYAAGISRDLELPFQGSLLQEG